MKLAKLAVGGRSFWAVVEPDRNLARELSGTILEWSARVLDGSLDLPFTGDSSELDGLRFLPPVEPVSKVLAGGGNYQRHLDEFNAPRPPHPIGFVKPYSALLGHNEEMRYPPITRQLDYEVELVVILGAAVAECANAIDCVLGYTVGNDVSARDLQNSPLGGIDVFSAKCHDRSSGMGPWIVTRDELPAERVDLAISLSVDGHLRQSDHTGAMIFSVAEILVYLDERSSLHAGDAVFTGTTAGIGMVSGQYLQPGNVVEATIEQIGTLRNRVGKGHRERTSSGELG